MPSPGKTRILIVEDSPTQAEELRFLLEEAGYEIATARDGIEALEALRAQRPGMVISDVTMPRMDGYALCQQVKSDPQLRDIPFVLLTTLSEPEDILKGLNSRADNFITKPYVEEHLLERLRFIGSRQAAKRTASRADPGVEVYWGGQRHFITADRLQILDLLHATYDKVSVRNQELEQAYRELKDALRTVGDMGGLLGTGTPPKSHQRAAEDVEILVAEDSSTQREQLKYVLETYGYRVTAVTDGRQALAAAERRKPSLIVSDVVMPEMDGYALCHAVKSGPALRDVPVILLTTMTDAKDIIRGIEAGASYYLTKPVNEEYLLSRIEFVLSQAGESSGAERRPAPEGKAGTVSPPPNADLQQILNLLLATYENAVQQNIELYKTKRELQQLNERLETKVSQRTVGLVKEIAERKQAEETLRASEEHYRLLFRNNPLPMWLFDCETLRFVAVNATATRHYGYSETEFLAMTIRDIRPEEDVPSLEEFLAGGESTGKSNRSWRHRKKSGEIIDVEIRSDPLVLDGRKCRLVLADDITEQKRATEALRVSEARFRELAEHIRDVFYNHDPRAAQMLYVSPAYETIWGRTCESLYADPLSYLTAVHAEDRALVEEAFHRQVAGEATEHEYRILRPDGEMRWIHDTAYPVFSDGEVDRIVGTARDITERKKLEQQFFRAQRLESIGTLAGGIAHDLNNLLAPIIMGVGLLPTLETREQQLKIIQTIERSAKRGTNLVKQVLSFARGIEGSRVAVHLGHLIDDLDSLISSTFPKNITFEADYPKDIWLVMGDPTQLHQVLLNLCVNARDAMPDGGRLTITACNTSLHAPPREKKQSGRFGRFVVLEVADTGTGISPATIDRIFEPFFTTKGAGSGTGLGLSTALGIVRSHGGFIDVDSEPGQGTTFRVHLPPQAEDQPIEPTADNAAMLPRGNGELVLVVDDETTILGITKQMLEAFGYRVLTAEDGAQALAAYVRHRDEIAVVVTDMMMPVMDGRALITALQQAEPAPRIIAVSGADSEGKAVQLEQAGVSRFLAKPYSADRLLTALKAALSSEQQP